MVKPRVSLAYPTIILEGLLKTATEAVNVLHATEAPDATANQAVAMMAAYPGRGLYWRTGTAQ